MVKESTTFSTIQTPSSYPASRKRYLQGGRLDVRAPYREITLSDTRHRDHTEDNPPEPVYDTSGSYTDPEREIQLTQGLHALRVGWIKERDDTEILKRPSSHYARSQENNLLDLHLRFPSPFASRPARDGKNVSQMHYARKGIVTAEMEFVALRESMLLERLLQNPLYVSQHRNRHIRRLGRLPRPKALIRRFWYYMAAPARIPFVMSGEGNVLRQRR